MAQLQVVFEAEATTTEESDKISGFMNMHNTFSTPGTKNETRRGFYHWNIQIS